MQRIVLGLFTCLAILMAGCSSSSTTGGGGGGATSPTLPGPTESGGGSGSKLVGTWESPGGTIEFKADGKLIIMDGPIAMNGTYKHEGDKLTTTLSVPDPLGKGAGKDITNTMTIVKLTDTEVTAKDASGKDSTLKKKK